MVHLQPLGESQHRVQDLNYHQRHDLSTGMEEPSSLVDRSLLTKDDGIEIFKQK